MCRLLPLEIGKEWTKISMIDLRFTKDSVKGTGKALWTITKVIVGVKQ